MKIIHVVESFSAGTFDFIASMVSGMPEMQHLIVHGMREDTPDSYREMFPPTTEYCRWPHVGREISPLNDFRALKNLVTILRQYANADVIHLHSSKAGFLGRCAARFLGKQHCVLYTPHAVSFLRKDVSSLKRSIYVAFERFGAWMGGEIVACSPSEQAEFVCVGIGADAIENGVTLGVRPVQRDNHPLLLIGTMGRVSPQKNPHDFNVIASHFLGNDNIRFRWIGDGELRHVLNSGNIEITGWLPKHLADAQLADIDLYLSTSKWEGLPLSVLTAMVHGKPLLLSRCVGNVDLVRDGRNGYLYDGVDDAIKRLSFMLSDRASLNLFGRYSRLVVEQDYSRERMVERYRQAYETIAQRNRFFFKDRS